MSFMTTRMDLEGIMPSEKSQKKQILYALTHVKSKKQNERTTNQKWTHKCRERTGGYQRRGGGRFGKIHEGD